MRSGAPTRKKALARTGGPTRSRLRSKKRHVEPPHEQRERETITQQTSDDILRFVVAARDQMVCAVCGRGGSFDSHHVIEKQELKNRGLWQWDPRNALRLCDDPAMGCHQQHTYKGGADRVPLAKLTDASLDYAFEVLGVYAYDYLKRRYHGDDPRVERRLKEATS